MYKLIATGYTVGMVKHSIVVEFPLADAGYTVLVINSIIEKLSDIYIKLYWDVRNECGEIVDLDDIVASV